MVAQLVRASACHAEGRGFKSLPSRHKTTHYNQISYIPPSFFTENYSYINNCFISMASGFISSKTNIKKSFYANLFVLVFVLSTIYLSYVLLPKTNIDYNYSKSSVRIESGDTGIISSLSTRRQSKITISPQDIYIASVLVSLICYFIFYYGVIIYLQSKKIEY